MEKKSASGVKDLYNQMKDDIKKPLHIWSEKLKSPFWLTYILWWVVFNYDFLLILFGFEQKLIAEQDKQAILEEQYKNALGIEDDIPF